MSLSTHPIAAYVGVPEPGIEVEHQPLVSGRDHLLEPGPGEQIEEASPHSSGNELEKEMSDAPPSRITPTEAHSVHPVSSTHVPDVSHHHTSGGTIGAVMPVVERDLSTSGATAAKHAPAENNSGEDSEELDEPEENVGDEHLPLLTKLVRSPSSSQKLLADWLAQLTVNGPASVASILSFIIAIGRPVGDHSSQQLISPHMVIANQPAVVISELVSILSSDPHARVPIMSKDAQSKRIRRAYEEFWRRLPIDASSTVIFDTDCVETLIFWIESMASAASRGLRLAACLAAYRMVDGFISERNRLQSDLTDMQRQLSTEKTKSGTNSGTPKASRSKTKPLSSKGKALSRNVEELSANLSELSVLCEKIFRSLFVLKYRDVAPDIRAVSVGALGDWMLAFPQKFFDDIHLKYVGWLLYDKDAVVRKGALSVLYAMVQKKDFLRGLQSFLGRFCLRVVEMCHDKDENVSVAAIVLLTALESYDMVDQDSCETVCDIAIEELQPDIRRAAGEFLSKMIIRQTTPEQSASSSGRKPQKQLSRRGRRAAAPRASELIGRPPPMDVSREHIKQFLFAVSRKDSNCVVASAVDAVWNHLPALRCWEAYTDLLIDRSGTPSFEGGRSSKGSKRKSAGSASTTPSDDALSDSDKSKLCEVLLAAAIEATGHGDAARAKLILQTESEEESISQIFTRHMILQLPKLLMHFQADGPPMKSLVQIPKLYQLDALEQGSFKGHLESLLERLIDALTRHSGHSEVAFACSGTFRLMLKDGHPMKATTTSSLHLACAKASKDFCVAVLSDLADVEPETIKASLLRLRILSELVEPGDFIIDPLLKTADHQLEKGSSSRLPESVTRDAVRTLAALAVWSLLKVRSRAVGVLDGEEFVHNLFHTEGMLDIQSRGSQVLERIMDMCACSDFSINVKTVCLQSLLTMLTLCHGIERFFVGHLTKSSNLSEADAVRSNIERDLDLLKIKAKKDKITETVTDCIYEIISHESSAARQMRSHSQSGSRSSDEHEDEIKQALASLVQASVQSAVSREICHLPLLGLCLKRRRSKATGADINLSAFEICRHYYELRIIQMSGVTEQEVHVLAECSGMERRKEGNFLKSDDICEAMICLRRGDAQKNAFGLNILKHFVNSVVDEGEERRIDAIVNCVRLLCDVGAGLVGYFSKETAREALVQIKKVENFLKNDWIADECGEVEASVEGLLKALEAVEENDPRQRRRGSVHRNLAAQLDQEDDDDESDDNFEGRGDTTEDPCAQVNGVGRDASIQPSSKPDTPRTANAPLRRSSRLSRLVSSSQDSAGDEASAVTGREVNNAAQITEGVVMDGVSADNEGASSTQDHGNAAYKFTAGRVNSATKVALTRHGKVSTSTMPANSSSDAKISEENVENVRGSARKKGANPRKLLESPATAENVVGDYEETSHFHSNGITPSNDEILPKSSQKDKSSSSSGVRDDMRVLRRSKRKRSPDQQQIGEEEVTQSEVTGGTPASETLHPNRSRSAGSNPSAEGAVVSSVDPEGRTRSAKKSGKVSAGNMEVGSERPMVRRRKRHRW